MSSFRTEIMKNSPCGIERWSVSWCLLIGLTLLTNASVATAAPFTFATTGSLTSARYEHTSTLLLNGKVLVAGGTNGAGVVMSSAELYDPVLGTWTATGSMAGVRDSHTATLLP